MSTDDLPPGFRCHGGLGGLVLPESVKVPDTPAALESETTAPLDVVDLRERLTETPQPQASESRSSSETATPTSDSGKATTPVEPNEPNEKAPAVGKREPESMAAVPQAQPGTQPTPTPQVQAPPPLTVPSKPQRKTSPLVEWWATAFPQLIWLAVIAGLTGQIFGWTKEFGGTPIAIGVAVVLGGTFEFIMVAASSRGLRDIGEGRPIWQAVIFLAAGTACAGLAVYMALSHFTGNLEMAGRAAAAATAIGYLAHVFTHLFDELDNRSTLLRWQQRRDEIQQEIDAREAAARAAHDAMQRESLQSHTEAIRRQRAEQAQTVEHSPTTSGSVPTPRTKDQATKVKTARKIRKSGGKEVATKPVAVRIGVEKKATTPSTLRAVLVEEGYGLPASSTTIENWCKEIKAKLNV